MRINLLQFMAFAFMLGWIGTDVLNGANVFGVSTYNERLCISSFLALIVGYLNNAHGMMWKRLKKMVTG